jgi:hypothetical protein
MPKVKMMSGIAAISGKFGNMYFRTDRRTGRISLCHMPQQKAASAPTPQQEAHKKRFAAIAKRVTELRQTYKRKTRKQLWKIASEAYDAANQL